MKKERINPFNSVYEICNSGNSRYKLNKLPEFPRYIDIELTNTCNFRCLMCPTGTLSQKRKKGFMKDQIYYQILDELKEYKSPLRFVRWGEPTLHPKLLDYIQAAKNLGLLCHLNTNGQLLDEDKIQQLIDIPLDSIKFSFQGVDQKTYREMRNIDFYSELLALIKLLYRKRGKKESPYIHVSTTITYETKEQTKKFKELVTGFSDFVTIGRTVLEHIDVHMVKLSKGEKNTLKQLKMKESVIKKHPECPEVFDKLSINWDGTVSACCRDYDNKMVVGDIRANSLSEIWYSKKFSFYRKMLVDMRHDELELCKSCYDFQSLQTPGLQKT